MTRVKYNMELSPYLLVLIIYKRFCMKLKMLVVAFAAICFSLGANASVSLQDAVPAKKEACCTEKKSGEKKAECCKDKKADAKACDKKTECCKDKKAEGKSGDKKADKKAKDTK